MIAAAAPFFPTWNSFSLALIKKLARNNRRNRLSSVRASLPIFPITQ
jgi:hypothetical protein